MTEKLKACPRDAAIHAVALIEMGREGAPYSRDQEEFYSDAAEVVDAVLAAVTPTPDADEVEAVAKAIHRARFPETYTAHEDYWQQLSDGDRETWFHVARAAISAMQARSAEPAGMMDAAWDAHQNTGIDQCADSDDETRKCVENAVRAALRHTEPAGEEPVAKKHGPGCGSHNDYPCDCARPSTPTNPERLVKAVQHLLRVGEFCRTDDTESALRRVRAALSAAPLKEGEGE